MEKPNFEYKTLDQALKAAGGKFNREIIGKADPEGFGPETKKAFSDVYGREGRNVVMNQFQNWVEYASGERQAELAVEYAQHKALEIIAAREIEQAKTIEDVDSLACNIGLILRCMRGQTSYDRDYWQTTAILGAEKVNEIGAAVVKDLGLTVEEAERLREKYQQLCDKRAGQYRAIGHKEGECVSDYLEALGWKRGEKQEPYLKKAVEDGVDLSHLHKPANRGLFARVLALFRGE